MSKRERLEPLHSLKDSLKEHEMERAALRAHLYLSTRALSFFQANLGLSALSGRRTAPLPTHPTLATLELAEARAPLGDPNGLTRECVVELSELIKRLTFTWLSELGVRKARYAHPQQGDVRIERLWAHPAWSSLALGFGAQSIDLLNALCVLPDQPQLKEARGLLKGWRLEQDGDLLFHLLCYLSLTEERGRLFSLSSEDHLAFARNPLALLRLPFELIKQASRTHDQLVERLSVLCEPTLTTLWPWVLPLLVQGWIKQARLVWHRLRKPQSEDKLYVSEHFNGQAALFKALEEVARRKGRLDLCVPLIMYFTSLQPLWSQLNVAPATQVQSLLSDVFHSEREPFTQGLIEVMKGPARLAVHAASVTRTHRFDREPSDNLFLSEYQASELEHTLPLYAELTNALEPTIG